MNSIIIVGVKQSRSREKKSVTPIKTVYLSCKSF